MQTGSKCLGDVSGQDTQVNLEKKRVRRLSSGQTGVAGVQVCKNCMARGGGEKQV